MAELTKLNVEYDPELGFNEMRALLKDAKAKAGEADTDADNEGGDGESEEGKKPEQKKEPAAEPKKAPVNPRLPKAPTEPAEGEETRTINTNVKHNGTLYEKGTQVAVSDENFEGLEAGGFLVPLK